MQKESLNRVINYLIRCIQSLPDSGKYNFNFKEPHQYQSLEEFAEEIDRQGYHCAWKNVSKDKLMELEAMEKIKVFKLHNKDFRKVKLDDSKHNPNLFTLYWLDAMNSYKANVRLLPEVDLYKRARETQLKVSERDVKCNINNQKIKSIKEKNRLFQDKLYASFKLEFYPENEGLGFEQVNDKVNNFCGSDTAYYLGLDRGEKELVTFCLVDSDGRLVKNGDWTKFKEVDYADKLKQFYYSKGEIESTQQQLSKARDNIKQATNTEDKESMKLNYKKLELKLKQQNLLAQEFIKKAYCGYLIDSINEILREYPNTYLVLEDLDIAGKADPESGMTNKEQNLNKTMGASVYQAIENAIVNKFKYRTVKLSDIKGLQTVPNVVKVEDLREVKEVKDGEHKFGLIRSVKSKDQIGNILFVDEGETSNTCPNCGFNSDWFKRDVDFDLEIVATVNGQKNAVIEQNDKKYRFPGEIYKLETINKEYETNKRNLAMIFKPRAKACRKFINNNLDKNDYFYCPYCAFSSKNCNNSKLQNGDFVVDSGDDVAAYNIAIKGVNLIKNSK